MPKNLQILNFNLVKMLFSTFVFLLILGFGSGFAWAVESDVDFAKTSTAAVLIDRQTGQILWQKNATEPLPPASTTKILTAILAIDTTDLLEKYTVSAATSAVEESSAYLQVGEVFDLGNLLNAALIKSANDACYAIAELVAGDEPYFVELMNAKAKLLGANTVVAKNTNGLPDDEHLMSALDLANIARVAMENEEFASRVALESGYMMGGSYNRTLSTTNKLLSMNEYVVGIKTGTTDDAGACLVSCMERDGRSVIAVVLHSGDRYNESLALLNYGIDEFENLQILKSGQLLANCQIEDAKNNLEIVAATDLWVTVAKSQNALREEFVWSNLENNIIEEKILNGEEIMAGDTLGTLKILDGNVEIASMPLIAKNQVDYPWWKKILMKFGW